jgi:hypothetical protein
LESSGALASWNGHQVRLKAAPKQPNPSPTNEDWIPATVLERRFLVPASSNALRATPKLKMSHEMKPFAEQIGKLILPCFSIVATVSEGSSSRAGGARAHGKTWPKCPTCGSPPYLVIELDLAETTSLLNASGFLQVYGCDGCATCSARHVHEASLVSHPKGKSKWDELPIRFEKGWDLPRLHLVKSWDDARESFAAKMTVDSLDEFDTVKVDAPTSCASIGIFGGYAYWEQDDETPNCSQCSQVLRYLLMFQGEAWFGDGNVKVFCCAKCNDLNQSVVIEEQ